MIECLTALYGGLAGVLSPTWTRQLCPKTDEPTSPVERKEGGGRSVQAGYEKSQYGREAACYPEDGGASVMDSQATDKWHDSLQLENI